jgi:glutamate synthase domain-containing protein 1/glutamate synthase domain-containing protein 3
MEDKKSLALIKNILNSRRRLAKAYPPPLSYKVEEEGGCGVTGFACSIPVSGRHIFEPSVQMHNRGNGKGGGIAAVGLSAEELGVTQEVLDTHYMLQIALLDPESRPDIETSHINPFLEVHKVERIPTLDDHREAGGLEVKPPDVWRYFVRVKEKVLERFIEESKLESMDIRKAEDEFIHQNSFKLNQKFYASLGEQKAFVLSHGRNMMILKIVGYAEQVAQYYKLDDFKAHIWIAHQRYPTKGRVWHPGGAHPFSGMDEALVHNGDFANYFSVSEYLKQRNIYPLFLTDTEVSILLIDLWNRVYGYPLEYIIEALAPTTEMDFDLLPPEKQKIYRMIQTTHIHGSPDGPWFFIIARNDTYEEKLQLIGITDTAMLRPQVFALQEGKVQIGLICSEKQAIDATLHSLSQEDKRFCPVADKYWNARGGSHTDGGSFLFTLKNSTDKDNKKILTCTDKFGRVISTPEGQVHWDKTVSLSTPSDKTSLLDNLRERLEQENTTNVSGYIRDNIINWDYNTFCWCCQKLVEKASENEKEKAKIIEIFTSLIDYRYNTGDKKRSSILQILDEHLHQVLSSSPLCGTNGTSRYNLIDYPNRSKLVPPHNPEQVLIIHARDFSPEGDHCDARLITDAYQQGWRKFMVYDSRGQRFCGCGLGPDTEDVRIDAYGSSGDYLASAIDGLEIYVHGNAQDQLGQIMKAGKLVVYGDVGQTFMYGAKGGEVYVMGNAAGRPLINAVGRPRVVINGTCLDYLAESFMAGDPFHGGGFVILNGMGFDDKGKVIEQASPYPGSNLFSLASGGALYARDPHKKLVEEQLNGSEFVPFTQDDWNLILPYLKENERLFGISIQEDLLTVEGMLRKPQEVYRKVRAVKLDVLTEVEGD